MVDDAQGRVLAQGRAGARGAGRGGLLAVVCPGLQPAPLHLSSGAVAAGDVVTLSAPAAACRLDLGPGATYRLTFTNPAGDWPVGTVRPERDGRFSVAVTVPAGVVTGGAMIQVGGAPSYCPPNASCVGYAIVLRVR